MGMQDLIIGEYYRIKRVGQPTHLAERAYRFIDEYGTWQFVGIAGTNIYFEDQFGAALSIPKALDSLAPAEPWMLELVGNEQN